MASNEIEHECLLAFLGPRWTAWLLLPAWMPVSPGFHSRCCRRVASQSAPPHRLWNRDRGRICRGDARLMRGLTKEEKMTATDRLWLNGFTTMSEVLANDRLALEEVRQALEDDSRSDE